MKFGLREILLAVAVVLFLLAMFLDQSSVDLVTAGLAAFAAGVLVTGLDTSGFGRRLR